jgi:transposase-like protein
MVKYNKQDVVLLAKVFNKLRPYVANHFNRELYGGTGCPRCGSNKIQSRGVQRAITRTYQRFQCQSCSGWFRALKTDKGSATPHRVI